MHVICMKIIRKVKMKAKTQINIYNYVNWSVWQQQFGILFEIHFKKAITKSLLLGMRLRPQTPIVGALGDPRALKTGRIRKSALFSADTTTSRQQILASPRPNMKITLFLNFNLHSYGKRNRRTKHANIDRTNV